MCTAISSIVFTTFYLPALAAADDGVSAGPVVRINMKRRSRVHRSPQQHGVPRSNFWRKQWEQIIVGVDLNNKVIITAIIKLLSHSLIPRQGRSQKFVLGYKFFWGGIKLQYSCSVAVLTSFLPNKKCTWSLGLILGYIYTHIGLPLVATPLFHGRIRSPYLYRCV